MSEPHWHVLGAGAIGCLFGEALSRGGCNTTLLMRAGTTKVSVPVMVQRNGSRSELRLPVATAENCGPISHLLVTTKAYDVRSAVATVGHHLHKGSNVLLLVNGMGLAEQLHEDFSQLDLYCGTTTEGVYRVAPQYIHHAGRGQTHIGQQGQEKPAPWFGQWSRAIDCCTWDMNIEAALWSKLAINCAINPLTALHACRNGDLARRPELAAKAARLCEEIAHISRAAGYTEVAATLQQMVAGVIAGTADNRSSMLQDVQGGRRTEIDYITGYLLKIAGRHGIDAPHNTALLDSIRNIER